jgi:hypothetical protein
MEISPLQYQIWNYMEPLLQANNPSTPFYTHMNKIIQKYESAPFIIVHIANYNSCPPEISVDDLNMLLRIRDCDYHQDLKTRLNLICIWNIVNKYILNDLLLFFEPKGELHRENLELKRENLELKRENLLCKKLQQHEDEMEVSKSNSNVEKVYKEVLIIKEAQSDHMEYTLRDKENDCTPEIDMNASKNYSPELMIGLMLGSVLGVIMTAFAIKIMTI